MAAIITNKFRINNAEQFTESFSEDAATTYYLFIGRPHAWATDADPQGVSVVEGTDVAPPTPTDTMGAEFYAWDDMIGMKKIASTDVSYVIPRRDWTTGTTYDYYSHDIATGAAANSGATNLFDATFHVVNSNNDVYKCIWNDANTASTTEPTSTSNSIATLADGYKWKYMYSLTAAEAINFKSTDFIHVSTDSTVSAAAVDGALDTVVVVAGGSSYTLSSGSTITAIPIRGDGSGGICTCTIASGAVSAVTVTTAGTGYTYAYIRSADVVAGTNAAGGGSGCNLKVIIPPKEGHGNDAVKELGGYFVMLNKSLVGLEGTSDITVSNDFRRIGVVRNPTNYGTSTVASATTRRQLKVVLGASYSGTFTADEEINQATTGAVGKVVEWDSTNKLLHYIQTRFPDVGTDSNGNATAFSTTATITGQSSSATLVPVSSSSTVNSVVIASGYSTPEVEPDSGDIIYIEQRSPIARAADQTENIKLIIEF